jgi:outer membrane lipoprotein-sorting protein
MSIVCFSKTSFSADTNAVLQAWLNAQTNLRSWQADFTQTRSMKTLTQPLVATGRVWFKPPNRFRWELGSPAKTLAIRSADEMFVVYPLLKRAERYPVGAKATREWQEMLALLEAGFPRSSAELASRFRVLETTNRGSAWQITLQPRTPTARRMMNEIRLGIATNNFSLASTKLVFADGSTMRNDFTNVIVNPDFDEKVFEWEPPPNFTVSEPLNK